MATKAAAALSLLLLIFLTGHATAHNITRLLCDYPSFSTFNSLLTNSKVADQINHRRTITVLAVPNSAIGSLAGLSPEIQRRVLSVHVILDYYDLDKLHSLKKHSTILTTLFQTTGIAENSTGFLNVTKFANGSISFGSAAPGLGLVSDLVSSVAARPYNISVLQVTAPIIPPAIDGLTQHAPPPPPAATAAPSPSSSKTKAPAPDKSPEAAPVADAPVLSDAPADAPTSADAPADSPDTNTPEGDGDGPDEEIASAADRLATVGASLGVTGAVLLALL